jgi:hypothetical protein
MTEFKVVAPNGNTKDGFNDRAKAGAKAEELDGLFDGEVTVEPVEDEAGTDGGNAEVVEPVDAPGEDPTVEPADLSENPIDFLRSVNGAFVNTIQGKPAISKRGFRFIQREFEISTESEVVEWSDDPLGCVVWAKAELPGGYSAEAHGEGYQFENDVSDNEFVRYADTRAKNRAISDLTSAGAMAVSELGSEVDA